MILLWLVITLLGGLIPALFLFSVDGTFTLNVGLALGVVWWCTLRLAHTGTRGERRLTLMCFYAFVYVFFGLQPMMSLWTSSYSHEPYLTAHQATTTIGVVVLGNIGFEIGYRLWRRRPVGVVLDYLDRPLPQWPPVQLSLLWVGIAASFTLVLLAIQHYGLSMFLNVPGLAFVTDGAAITQTQSMLVAYGLRGLLATLLFITVHLWVDRKRVTWSGAAIGQLRWALLTLAIGNLLVSSPLSTARLWWGSIVLTVVFIALRWDRRRSFLRWSGTACAGLLFLFAGLDPRRIIGRPLLRGEPVTVDGTLRSIAESVGNVATDANFDSFQMLGLMIDYTEDTGYRYGHQLLLPALFWVPRSVWPTKPIGSSEIVARSLNFSSTNVGSPFWGEAYLNLGALGVVMMLGAFGSLARAGDDFLTRTAVQRGPLLPTVCSCFFAGNTFILLRGDLTTGTMYLQMVVGFAVLVVMFIQRRTHRPIRRVGPIRSIPNSQ